MPDCPASSPETPPAAVPMSAVPPPAPVELKGEQSLNGALDHCCVPGCATAPDAGEGREGGEEGG